MATALLMTGQLEVWHIYLFTALNSSFGAFQGPAFGAAITHLVPKAQYGRTNGMMQLGNGVGQIIAPVLAGVLIAAIGLQGVLLERQSGTETVYLLPLDSAAGSINPLLDSITFVY